MGRSPAHSDFSVTPRAAPPPADDDDGADAAAGTRRLGRWLLGATLLLFVALLALVGVGLHLPSGG